MTKKDYEIIASAIWRSGYMRDKNEIRRKAKNDVRRLIASDLSGEFKKDKQFDEEKFLKLCGVEY